MKQRNDVISHFLSVEFQISSSSVTVVDICPRCFEIYKQKVEDLERRFLRPDLRDAEV